MRAAFVTAALCALISACEPTVPPVVIRAADEIPNLLSEWGVVFADGERFELNAKVVPYDLKTPLFTDYALKLRTVWLPEGTSANYNDSTELDFPVGTIISKTFYYQKAEAWSESSASVVKADRESSLDDDGQIDLDDYVLIETRLLVRYAGGWQAFPYVWNAAQNEAFLEIAGDARKINLVSEAGSNEIVYIVPDANQCGGCHVPNHSAKEFRPLGPKGWQLNRPYDWWGDSASQLDHWVSAGLLSSVGVTSETGVRWARPGDATLEQRAKSYLDANCAHCHNVAGAANTSALDPNIDAPVDRRYGICKTPVAVGRGSGDRPYDIYPGKPNESILLYRMQHTDPAIAMPELGRSAVHTEGVAVISDWIAAMNGDC